MASKRPGPSSLPKISTASPVTQTVQQPKPKPSPPSPPPQALTLKDLQDALDKTLEKTAELLAQKNNELREDIVLALQGLAGLVEKIDDRVDEVAGNDEILQDRVEKIEDNVDVAQNEIIMSQYREMEYALRIRGLKENVQENLKEEIAAELASILEIDLELMLRDIEKIFRVNSWVAKQRNLPRDVVVYFARKSLHNEIIQAFYKQRFQIAAQDVMVLKEIPSKILRKRKDFAFLAEELKKRQIQFRWDVPVGIVVIYVGTRYRLNTVAKAKDFYVTILKGSPPPSPRSKKDESKVEAQLAAGSKPLLGELLVESMQQNLQITEDPREQRITRAAYKCRERQQQQQQQQQQQKVDDGVSLQSTSEPVGGARPKKSLTANLEVLFQRLQPAKNGKASNLEC